MFKLTFKDVGSIFVTNLLGYPIPEKSSQIATYLHLVVDSDDCAYLTTEDYFEDVFHFVYQLQLLITTSVVVLWGNQLKLSLDNCFKEGLFIFVILFQTH